MKNLKIIFLIPFLMLFIANCGDEESQKFVEKKLELRQRMDETILNIDTRLEEFQEELENTQDEERSYQIKKDMNKLKLFRDDLNDKLEKMKNVTEYDWKLFKERAGNKINEVEGALTLMEIEPSEVPPPLTEPYEGK